MAGPSIFISYRRDDAAGYARAVGDELARHFGADRVFMDVDDIGAGQAFDDAIERALGGSAVLLVMIGKRWRGERNGQPARIDDADDFVRREVATGLARGLRVIPLLLDGAPMPAEAALPEPLRPLARRNAMEIGHTRFRADVERLVEALQETLGTPSPAPAAPSPPTARKRWAPTLALIAAVTGLALYGWLKPPPAVEAPNGVAAGNAGSAPSKPAVDGPWQADVTYDWPNARYSEHFQFTSAAGELGGSASFLRVPRGILEGRVGPEGLSFVTYSRESVGDASATLVHRYRGRWDGDALRFTMQTEGGSSAHVPVEFVARRAVAASGAR